MPEKRKKKSFFDIFDFGEEDFLFGDDSLQNGSSDYSISVTYDEHGKPIVRAKTHGDVDVNELRKDLEQKYPGARIEGLDEKPLIRIVNEKEEAAKETKPKEKKKPKKDKEKSLIRIIE